MTFIYTLYIIYNFIGTLFCNILLSETEILEFNINLTVFKGKQNIKKDRLTVYQCYLIRANKITILLQLETHKQFSIVK